MEEENQSVFVEYLGGSPYIKVLDFLIQGQLFDYSMTEVARGAGVGWSAFTKVWAYLIEKNFVVKTREIGNAKLFKLNKDNQIVQKMVKLDFELTKLATEEILNEKVVVQ